MIAISEIYKISFSVSLVSEDQVSQPTVDQIVAERSVYVLFSCALDIGICCVAS
jgi:hypothetical protein